MSVSVSFLIVAGLALLILGVVIGLVIARSIPQTLGITIWHRVEEPDDTSEAWKGGGA